MADVLTRAQTKVTILLRSSTKKRFPIGLSYRVFAAKTNPWWRDVNGIRIDIPGGRVLYIEIFDGYRRGPLFYNDALRRKRGDW